MDILSDGTAPGQRVRHSHDHHALETVVRYTCLACGYEELAADDAADDAADAAADDAADDADAETVAGEEIPVCSHCGELADLWISLLPETVPAVPLCLSCALAASRKIADAVGNMLDSLNTADEDPADEHETDSAPAAARSSAPTPIPIPIPIPGGNRATRRAAMRRRHQPVPLRRVRKGKRP